jgi:hypothetical protein
VRKRLGSLKEQRKALETTIAELEDIERQAAQALAMKFGDRKQAI